MDEPEVVDVPSCHICACQIVNPEKCGKCGSNFCDEHTNKLDVKFCSVCMVDVVILEDKFTKTDESYDEDTDVVTVTKHSCRQIKFQGQDWVWYGRKIRSLSDDELKTVLEYHRGMVYQIEHEITFRKVQAQFKTPAVSFPITKTTEVKQKKQARTKQLDPNELAAKLKALGLTPEALAASLGIKTT